MIEKKEFLLKLMREYYKDAISDSLYAHFNENSKNWHFGYLNDYPLQHGEGAKFFMKDKLLEALLKISN